VVCVTGNGYKTAEVVADKVTAPVRLSRAFKDSKAGTTRVLRSRENASLQGSPYVYPCVGRLFQGRLSSPARTRARHDGTLISSVGRCGAPSPWLSIQSPNRPRGAAAATVVDPGSVVGDDHVPAGCPLRTPESCAGVARRARRSYSARQILRRAAPSAFRRRYTPSSHGGRHRTAAGRRSRASPDCSVRRSRSLVAAALAVDAVLMPISSPRC